MKRTYKNLMKVIVLLALSLTLNTVLIAQTNGFDNLRMQYDSLDTKYFPSGILYNRSPHFLYCFKFDTINGQWLSNPDFASSPYKYETGYPHFKKSVFNILYEDMLYSANNNTILIQQDQYDDNDSIAKLNYDFPISLMQVKFHTLDLDAMREGKITFDTINDVYTIMPDTFWINDSIFTLIQNPDSLAETAFYKRDLHAAISTRSVVYKQFVKTHLDVNWQFKVDVTYNLPSNLFVHNNGEDIPTVQIDFDDGNGFVNVGWNASKTIMYADTILETAQGIPAQSGFCKVYDKIIKVKYPSLQIDLVMSFPVKIVAMDRLADTIIQTSTLPFTCAINEPNYSASEGKVSIRFAGELVHKITKPIIVVEGFESALKEYGIISYEGIASGFIFDEDGDESYEWIKQMHVLFDSLHNHGYDIIYVDHRDPKTWIQSNALSVIKVIQYVNSRLDSNKSNEKPVVMGASMGGLIVRYSLRKMELDGCCHNTRLYATFDTPHQGANIAPGLQHFIHELRHLSKDARKSYDEAINSPAARQMLVYHIESSATTDRNNWQILLDSMGHPQNCRRIALINGSELGTGYNLNAPNNELIKLNIPFIMPYKYIPFASTPLFNWVLEPRFPKLINFHAFSESEDTIFYGNNPANTLESITTSYIFYGVGGAAMTVADGIGVANPVLLIPMQLFKSGAKAMLNPQYSNLYDASIHVDAYSNSPYPLLYTTAPGGLSNTQEGIEKTGIILGEFWGGIKTIKAVSKMHSFIPSVSALDLKTTNLYQNIRQNYLANQNITEFDAYWATLRGDRVGEHNMMHVEVDQYNRAWIQEQVLNDWELRAANGEYKGILTSYYNYGRPDIIGSDRIITINKPYQTILYTLDIENNGVLYVNKQDKIGLSTGILLPRLGSTFKLKTNCNACDTTVVKIKDGGQFIVGDLNNGILNKGEVSFCKNSRLEIFNNGQLIIKDSSRLIIEKGATLVIHQGANILLDGANAVLEIRGKIIIDDHSTLEPQGSGFIRFAAKMGSTDYNDFWDIGHNSSLVLANYNAPISKKAEVIESVFFPDSLTQYFVNVRIEIDSMKAIYSYGSIQAQNSVFTAIDTNKFYRSVSVFGQPNTRFGSCRFEYGNMGLYAAMGSGGNTITLDTCTFTRNYIGLYTMDQYISLDDCKANYNLDYGWVAASMQANCTATRCEFNNNGYSGIKFDSQTGISLNLRSSELNDNYQNGVEIEWGILQANCSEFMRNGQAGIYAKEKSEINLSGISKNAIRHNVTGILFNMAKSIRLENGYNNFSGNQYYLIGEMMPDNYYIPNTSPYGIDIDNNLMPSTFFQGAIKLPINIYYYDPLHTAAYQMPINGWTQNINSLQCICPNIPIAANYDNYKMFEGLPSISLINTAHFPNTYLIDALKTAAMQMSYGDAYIGNDTLAIAMFKEIFDTIPPNIIEDERWAIDHSLGLMITALTNAIEQDLIDPNRALDGMPVDEYVAMIGEEIQNRLNDVDYANLYAEEQEAYFHLLMAQMYRAAEHYDYALAILQNDNYFFNTTLKNQADYWNCICNAENQLIKGNIEPSQYEQQIDSCHQMSTARRSMFMPIFGESEVNPNSKENQILGIYPNPAEQLIAIDFALNVKEVHIQLSDLSGRLIWETSKIVNGKQLRLKLPKVASGAYMLKTTTDNQVFNNKIIIR